MKGNPRLVAAIVAAVAGGAVLAAVQLGAKPPRPPVGTEKTQSEEYLGMCAFCESTDGGCYDYEDPSDGGHKGGGCTYPPCPAGGRDHDPEIEKDKLACASCRAMCPRTKGGKQNH